MLVQFIRRYRRPVLYIVVGGVNTGVDFAVFHILYLFTAFSPAFCQGVSYMTGVFCSFLLNRSFTFKEGAKMALGNQVGRFLAVNLISLAIGMGGMSLLVGVQLPTTIAKLLITVVTALINYFGYKILVFRVADCE